MKDDTAMKSAGALRTPWWRCSALMMTGLALLAGSAVLGYAQAGRTTAAGPEPLIHAADLGPMDSTSPVELTVWLKMRDSEGLDRTLAAQRNGNALLTGEQIDARHAPSAGSAAAVSAFLKAQGLTVSGVGPENFFIRAAGTAAAVDAAFRVQLHQYRLDGRTFHASAVAPTLPAAIAAQVVSIGGLSGLRAQPDIIPSRWDRKARHGVHTVNELADKPLQILPLSAMGLDSANPSAISITSQCFFPPSTVSFTNGTATASYTGAVLGNTAPSNLAGLEPPCIYVPSDLYTAYNLTPLYKAGLDGTGQTIAIVDAYGSLTIQQDLAAFSSATGLPAAKFQVIGTLTGSILSSDTNVAGWASETTLDVEWAHAIAPGAKIVLVIPPLDTADDLVAADLTAAQQPGVTVISNSWGFLESLTDVPFRATADGILKLAAAKGIAVNYSSGDSGNDAVSIGNVDVSYPASSPYATSVGGVSVVLDQSKHILFQTAWGDSAMLIAQPSADGSSQPVDPPAPGGFQFGGGGGVSNVYPLPPWQQSLSRWGNRRLLPDVSWVADPFTPVAVLITADAQGDLGVLAAGGTSVAAPMFSGLWAVATQKARRPLGQAAPRLYTLPPDAFNDVLAPQDSGNNVTGTLTDASGTQQLTAQDLALPLQGQRSFLSVLYNGDSSEWFVSTFGTDSTLIAGPGWDPATGLGTPNGVTFVNAVAP